MRLTAATAQNGRPARCRQSGQKRDDDRHRDAGQTEPQAQRGRIDAKGAAGIRNAMPCPDSRPARAESVKSATTCRTCPLSGSPARRLRSQGGGDDNALHAGPTCRLDASRRILEHHVVGRTHPQTLSRNQKHLGDPVCRGGCRPADHRLEMAAQSDRRAPAPRSPAALRCRPPRPECRRVRSRKKVNSSTQGARNGARRACGKAPPLRPESACNSSSASARPSRRGKISRLVRPADQRKTRRDPL